MVAAWPDSLRRVWLARLRLLLPPSTQVVWSHNWYYQKLIEIHLRAPEATGRLSKLKHESVWIDSKTVRTHPGKKDQADRVHMQLFQYTFVVLVCNKDGLDEISVNSWFGVVVKPTVCFSSFSQLSLTAKEHQPLERDFSPQLSNFFY